MDTNIALTNFFKWMRDQGKSPKTAENYNSRLRHFALEYPELPTDTAIIEQFLKARHETPAHRGMVFKCLQAFYSYLEKVEGIPSPVPSRGPVGRPRKHGRVRASPAATYEFTSAPQPQQLVQGGSVLIKLHIYLHTDGR